MDAKEAASSRLNRNDTHMNSETMLACIAPALAQASLGPSTELRKGMQCLAPIQETICNWYLLAKENRFVQWSVPGYLNNIFLMPRSSWPQKINSIFVCGLFVSFCFGFFFLNVLFVCFDFEGDFFEREKEQIKNKV